jgi:hypothetical protein
MRAEEEVSQTLMQPPALAESASSFASSLGEGSSALRGAV